MKAQITGTVREPGISSREFTYVVLNTIRGPLKMYEGEFHFSWAVGQEIWLDYVHVSNGWRYVPRSL